MQTLLVKKQQKKEVLLAMKITVMEKGCIPQGTTTFIRSLFMLFYVVLLLLQNTNGMSICYHYNTFVSDNQPALTATAQNVIYSFFVHACHNIKQKSTF